MTGKPKIVSEIKPPSRTTQTINPKLLVEFKKARQKAVFYKRLSLTIGGLVVVLLLIVVGNFIYDHFLRTTHGPDPLPAAIRAKVSFPVYYPDPTKLPNGYVINKSLITASNQVIIIPINYDNGQVISISEQVQPSSSDLSSFVSHYMPLHNTLSASIGQAFVGAVNNQSFVSLPTGQTWIIVTGPLRTNQNNLNKVILSLTQS